MSTGSKPWGDLKCGDGFSVRSRRGREYEATFLAAGHGDAGLYVRLRSIPHADAPPKKGLFQQISARLGRAETSREELSQHTPGRLARLDIERIDWSTFEPRSFQSPLFAGDNVQFTDLKGRRHQGVLRDLPEEALFLDENGVDTRTPLALIEPGSFRLLFPATDLRRGDEFEIRSRSGTEYAGTAEGVAPERTTVHLHDSQRVSLRNANLDFESLIVLIPLVPPLLHCSPSGA